VSPVGINIDTGDTANVIRKTGHNTIYYIGTYDIPGTSHALTSPESSKVECYI
jgi:hypothetical protein